MKNFIIFFYFLSTTFIFSQSNDEILLSKYAIKKTIIQGFEYRNDSLVDQSYHVDELDKYGNTIAFKTYDLKDSLIQQIDYYFSKDGMTEFANQIDKQGNLKYSFVTIKDNAARSIRKMQFSVQGDTLVEQIWFRDQNLNDSILFRVVKNKRFVQYKWNYNQGGMLVSKEMYDKNGNRYKTESYTYKKEENCLKIFNDNHNLTSYSCKEGNKEINKILKDREGYLFGIKLVSEKNGKRIETKLENGLLEKIEYFSKSGQLLALIKYSYVGI